MRREQARDVRIIHQIGVIEAVDLIGVHVPVIRGEDDAIGLNPVLYLIAQRFGALRLDDVVVDVPLDLFELSERARDVGWEALERTAPRG